jgi:hypothetical protein
VARRPDSPTYDGTPSFGSGPSTIADRRPRHTVEKASAVSVAEPAKEPVMKVASPKTPLELGASSAGSGASSSGDDAARTPSKWRAAAGSAASSGDEGCSSPDKRARLAIGDGDKAISGKSFDFPIHPHSLFFRPLALSFLLWLVCLPTSVISPLNSEDSCAPINLLVKIPVSFLI